MAISYVTRFNPFLKRGYQKLTSVPDASTSVTGIMAQATVAEVYAASINNKAVVPSTKEGGIKTYMALLTQSGTNAPVATIVGNNTVGTIVWSRSSTGIYKGTLANAFPLGKGFFEWSMCDYTAGAKFTFGRTNNNECYIGSINTSSSFIDGFSLYIRITVQP